MGALPTTPLAIGDTVTVPTSMGIPLPGLAEASGGNRIESKVTFKLVAIEREGDDRIAKLEQRTEGTLSGVMNMQMNGTGTLDWNVDKGFVRGGTSDLKLEMNMQVPGGTGTMKITGTIRMTLTGASQR